MYVAITADLCGECIEGRRLRRIIYSAVAQGTRTYEPLNHVDARRTPKKAKLARCPTTNVGQENLSESTKNQILALEAAIR